MGREGALSLLVWFSCVLAFFLCFFPYLRPHFIWLKCYDLCATRGHLEISRLKLRANEYLVTISWPADGLPKIRVCISRITYATSGSSADERLRTETCATAMRCDDLDAKGNAYITSPSCACVCVCVAAQSTINSCQVVRFFGCQSQKGRPVDDVQIWPPLPSPIN